MKLHREKPSPEFVERARRMFLAAYEARFSASRPAVSGFKYFLRGAAAGIAFMLTISGAAVYADEKNVGPESLLYPLKRSREAVSLALTGEAERPTLHLKFAERRLAELETVKMKNPESPQAARLAADLKDEFQNSFSAFQDEHAEGKDEKVTRRKPEKVDNRLESENRKHGGREGGAGMGSMRMITASSAGAIGAEATSAKPQFPEENNREQRKTEAKGPLEDASKKNLAPVCESLRALIGLGSREIQLVLNGEPELFTRFERNCEPVQERVQERIEDVRDRLRDQMRLPTESRIQIQVLKEDGRRNGREDGSGALQDPSEKPGIEGE